jgi:uncharacterized glyoxalase superfamily protein PhnB
MPYLVVKDPEAFIEFIKDVFDAKEMLTVPDEEGGIMHAEYSINSGTLMIAGAGGPWEPFPCSMFLVVKDVDALYAKAISHGATGNQEPDERGYGRAAGFLDKWGNQWWLNDPETR